MIYMLTRWEVSELSVDLIKFRSQKGNILCSFRGKLRLTIWNNSEHFLSFPWYYFLSNIADTFIVCMFTYILPSATFPVSAGSDFTDFPGGRS